MNTVQMYAGKGNNVHPTPQTAKNGPKSPPLVDHRSFIDSNTPITPLLDTLTSLHKWAADSLLYIKRRNHLNVEEKTDARQRLQQYEHYLRYLHANYFADLLLPESIPDKISELHNQQAKLNRCARYYEYPPYRLPDTIESAKPFQYITYQVSNYSFVTGVEVGDILKGKQVSSFAELEKGNLLIVTQRRNHRTPRFNTVGLFTGISSNNLLLKYDNCYIEGIGKGKSELWTSLFNVVHIHKVQSVQSNHVPQP